MRRCRKSGNHPQEDSAKSGYEVQNFNHPSISLATRSKNQYKNLEIFTVFPSLLRIEKLQNHFNIKFPIHKVGEILAIKKKAGMKRRLKKCSNFHMVSHFEKCSPSFTVN
jgi:hypothetical protein